MANLAQLVDAVPVVQSTADRTARFGNPSPDQQVYNKGTKAIERFDPILGWITEFTTQTAAAALGWFNVKDPAYAAIGDGNANDGAAIRAAISACATTGTGLTGGVVFFPSGKYMYTGTLQTPVGVNSGVVRLLGSGMRSTYLFPAGAYNSFSPNTPDGLFVCMCIGSLTSDNAGTFTNQNLYPQVEDISINGSLVTGTGSVVGLQITEAQKGYFKNMIIEAWPNSSLGLYLRGAQVTALGGGAVAAPHCWKVLFQNLVVATSGSNNVAKYACVLQNADENVFVDCNFACPSGMTQGADTIKTFWIQMGRNNLLQGCLQSGDTTALKTAYTGIVFGPPQNWAGTPAGSVLQTCDLAAVIEGFDICVVNSQDATGNTKGNMVIGFNPSIFNTAFTDGNAVYQQGWGFLVQSPLQNIWYYDGVQPAGNVGLLTANSANPSVASYNMYQTLNTQATTILSFTSGQSGQVIWIYVNDTFTVFRDQNNGGGGNIRCWGRQDIVGATGMVVCFMLQGATWIQLGAPIPVNLLQAFTIPSGIAYRTRTITAAYTATLNDHIILADVTGGAFTFTLPSAGGGNAGLTYRVKRKDSSANALTVTAVAGNIDNQASRVMAPLESRDFTSDGANWWVI